MLLSVDGRYELVVTECEGGATHRFRLDERALAVLTHDSARCLSEAARRLVALTHNGRPWG